MIFHSFTSCKRRLKNEKKGKLYDLLSREAAYNTIFIYQSIWPNLIVNSFRLNCSTYNNFFL